MFQKILFSLFFLSSMSANAAIADRNPIGKIEGKQSMINHPEGIAFSPSGDLVVIANAYGENLLFFRSPDCYSSDFPASPVFVIGGSKSPLGYPHDVDFTTDGGHLAVACASKNRLMIYRRDLQNGFYETEPFAVIEGRQAGLRAIGAVKYDPTSNSLGVCDGLSDQIALFHYNGETYDLQPYQVIRCSGKVLSRPDGLAFSKDGHLLAVASHGNHSVLIFEKKSGSQDEFSSEPIEILQGKETHFSFNHSLSFHPLDDTLAASSAGGRTTLALFQKVSDRAPRYSSFPSQTFDIYNPQTINLQKLYPEEGGVKGVAFSTDGKVLGLCLSNINETGKSIHFYSISTD